MYVRTHYTCLSIDFFIYLYISLHTPGKVSIAKISCGACYAVSHACSSIEGCTTNVIFSRLHLYVRLISILFSSAAQRQALSAFTVLLQILPVH